MLRTPRRVWGLAALLGVLLSACDDLPAGPQVWTRQAVGRRWVAVGEPQGLPAARTWLAWTAASAADSVRQMLVDAVRERRAGRIEVAMATEQAAAERAVAGLAQAPEAAAVHASLAALEEWAARAEGPAGSGDYPELARDLSEVRARLGAARSAEEDGDLAAASLHLTRGAGLARHWTPVAVAITAVVQAELRIAADRNPSAELVNARRLLRGARQGIADGDPARGLQRALYALQLIDHASGR